MIRAVIDTNILVSALWSKDSNPGTVLDFLLNGKIMPCFDSRILIEYGAVLSRPRFGFSPHEISSLMGFIKSSGLSVVPEPSDIPFAYASEKKFYEVAKHCGAKLIAGNIRHFPAGPGIITAADFIKVMREAKP